MQHSDKALILACIFGIASFVVIFFVLPNPKDFAPQIFLDTHLPLAQDRKVPIVPKQITAQPKATLTFVGDIMLARSVESSIAEHGPDRPFAKLNNLFLESDGVIGNFEGTVRDTRNIEVANQMIFDTTPDNVLMLAKAGFTHLSIANNHADDYGNDITAYTRQTIAANGMVPFGDPYQSERYIVRETINDIPLSLIGFHAFGEDMQPIMEVIKAESIAGQFVIVFPHWGVEYATEAPDVETNAAALFASAGADLIIGAHPHVIQNIDIINGVPVVYSLGNFLFDQDFSANTKRGLTVKVTITPIDITLNFTPVTIIDRQTAPMSAADSLIVCKELGVNNCELTVARQ